MLNQQFIGVLRVIIVLLASTLEVKQQEDALEMEHGAENLQLVLLKVKTFKNITTIFPSYLCIGHLSRYFIIHFLDMLLFCFFI